MADHRAISVVCGATARQLRLSYKAELFNNQRLEFKVCLASDLISRSRAMRAGVTLFLYQVSPDAARRNAPPHRTGDGRLEKPALQLDLRFLIWEKSVRSHYQLSVPYIARNITIAPLQPEQNRNDPG